MLSRALGEKFEAEAANKTAENGIFIEVDMFLFLLIGIFVTKAVFSHAGMILQIWVLNIQEFVSYVIHLVFLCRLVLKESFNPQDEQYSQ